MHSLTSIDLQGIDTKPTKRIRVEKVGNQRKIYLFFVVEIFQFILYVWFVAIAAIGAIITAGFTENKDIAFQDERNFGPIGTFVHFQLPPTTYVLAPLFAFCPVLVFLYCLTSIFRAWISKLENYMSGFAFAFYCLAFLYLFQSVLIFNTTFTVRSDSKSVIKIFFYTIPFINLVIGYTFVRVAAAWYISRVFSIRSLEPRSIVRLNYLSVIILVITSFIKITQHIFLLVNGSKELKDENGITVSVWRWNIMQNENIRIMLLVNDAIWMFCALVIPVFESWFLLSKQLDWHGQIISMKENKWEKSMYEPVPGNFWNSNSHSNDESCLSSTK